MPETTPPSSADRAALFVTTHWTVVLQAGSSESTQARPALEQLCQAYWYPIYAHVRRRGHQPHDAQDLTQAFFASLLDRSAFQSVSPEKGRFRSFLLASLGHFLSDDHDRRHAAKRGGGQVFISLDEQQAEARYALEPAHDDSPDKEFDRRWGLAVLECSLDQLAHEQAAAGRQKLFDRLRVFMTDATATRDYSDAAKDLKMPPNTVAVTVRRLRHRYRELVREQIVQTLARPEDIDAEMRHLLDAIRC